MTARHGRNLLLVSALLACWAAFSCDAQPVDNFPAGSEWMSAPAGLPQRRIDSKFLRLFAGNLQCDLSNAHGRFYAAENEMGELAKVFPNEALVWAAYAELEIRSSECGCGLNPAMAIDYADKAVAMAPDAPLPHLTSAKAHLAAGDIATAREEMRKAVDAGASRADIASLEALMAQRRGDDKANITWLAPVVGEMDQSAPQALAYASLGDSYRHLGQIADAEKMYRQGAALQACVAAPEVALANFILYEKGDVDGAQSILRALMQRLPSSELQRLLSVTDYYRWASGRESKSRRELSELAQSAYASPDEVFVDAARYPSGNVLLHKLIAAKVLQNVDARDAHDNTALIEAGLGNNLAGAAFLIANKADVNAENRQGQRALGFFSAAGNADAVKLLLSHGADLKYGVRDGESPLSRAVRAGHADIVKLLLKPPTRSRLSYDAAEVTDELTDAAQQGDRAMIALLIAAHGDVNAASERRMPPLIAAVLNHDVETARLLLDNKADPAIRFRGRSAMDYARASGNPTLVSLFARGKS